MWEKLYHIFRFNGSKFQIVRNSTFQHYRSRLANYKGDPFVVGSWTLQNGKKVERYYLSGHQEERYQWKSLGDYSLLGPKESQIRGYGVISLKESVLLFGGSTNEGQFSSFFAFKTEISFENCERHHWNRIRVQKWRLETSWHFETAAIRTFGNYFQ